MCIRDSRKFFGAGARIRSLVERFLDNPVFQGMKRYDTESPFVRKDVYKRHAPNRRKTRITAARFAE